MNKYAKLRYTLLLLSLLSWIHAKKLSTEEQKEQDLYL